MLTRALLKDRDHVEVQEIPQNVLLRLSHEV